MSERHHSSSRKTLSNGESTIFKLVEMECQMPSNQLLPNTWTLLRMMAGDERYSESVRTEAERRAKQLDEAARVVALLSAEACFA